MTWMLIVTGAGTPDAERRAADAAGNLLNDTDLGVIHARFYASFFDGDPRSLAVSEMSQETLRESLARVSAGLVEGRVTDG